MPHPDPGDAGSEEDAYGQIENWQRSGRWVDCFGGCLGLLMLGALVLLTVAAVTPVVGAFVVIATAGSLLLDPRSEGLPVHLISCYRRSPFRPRGLCALRPTCSQRAQYEFSHQGTLGALVRTLEILGRCHAMAQLRRNPVVLRDPAQS